MKRTFLTISFCLSLVLVPFMDTYAQKVDTDSLLIAAIQVTNQEKDYPKAIAMARQGASLAPDYLDFHLLLGRLYRFTGQADSARYFLNYVLEKSTAYEDAYTYLVGLELEEGEMEAGLKVVDQAIQQFPDKSQFYRLKLALVRLDDDIRTEFDYLKTLVQRFPEDSDLRQQLNNLELRLDNQRVGVNYSITAFDRDGVGPWHLVGAQYIRERRWGSIIGRVNYANRLSAGQSIDSGVQYELESYFFTGKRSYSYAGVAFSSSLVFPEQRYSYSFFQNLDRGWEWEAGLRYNSVNPPEGRRNFRSVVLGGGKYIGSSWLNLRAFIQNEEEDFYPAFTLVYRYFIDSRFDFATIILGYGTSPDERPTLGQFENRVALDSYRAGVGYHRLLANTIVAGVQATYNYQEFFPGRTQQEFEFSVTINYKF
ncbi:MAG: YaiO family outer membrane beta-barrel protein [Mongoliitalea sp.]